MSNTDPVAEKFAADVAAIGSNIDKLNDENGRMKRLLSQVALFVACQPENHFRTKWLQEFEELING